MSSAPSSWSSFYQDKVVVVTGGGSGIGQALCVAFAKAGASVVVVDLPHKINGRVLQELNTASGCNNNKHMEIPCDVTDAVQVTQMILRVNQHYSKLDIYCSNAGILIPKTPTPTPKLDDSVVKHSLEEWHRILEVNLLSHVRALRALLTTVWNTTTTTTQTSSSRPHLCVTASAAGLLTMVGDASYGVSKAAAVSFCEHVAISHPSIQVHCLCPQAVDTPLITNNNATASASSGGKDTNMATQLTNSTTTTADHSKNNAAAVDGIMTPQQVADVTLQGIAQGDFFIFPHTQVPLYNHRKAKDHKRWLQGMRRLRNKLVDGSNNTPPPLASKL